MENWVTANYLLRNEGEFSPDFHSHKEYEIYYFHNGDCKYLIHNRIYDLQPGDLILMDGLTLHRANPLPTKPYERSVIHFSPAWIEPVLTVLGASLLEPFSKLNNCLIRASNPIEAKKAACLIKSISELVHTANREQEDEKLEKAKKLGKQAEIKVLLIELLFQIYKMSKADIQDIAASKSEKDYHVENIAGWIEKNYVHKISLDDIAAALNLSKYYISHVFKEVTGFTVMEYLMICRLNQVKYLLEMHPEKSVTEVSEESGFESIAHFSRFFRKKLGVTPTAYRRRHSIIY